MKTTSNKSFSQLMTLVFKGAMTKSSSTLRQ